VTEIYDYMRLLFARVGVPYSPATGLPIEARGQPDGRPRHGAGGEGTRLYLLAPIVRGRKGEYRKEFAELHEAGLPARQGRRHEFLRDRRRPPTLDKKYKHDIDVVVDRIVVRSDIADAACRQLRDRAELADGMAIANSPTSRCRRKPRPAGANKSRTKRMSGITFSEKFACPVSGFTIPRSSRGCSPSTTLRRLPDLRRPGAPS
jgi:excinuclease ABC subunit A